MKSLCSAKCAINILMIGADSSYSLTLRVLNGEVTKIQKKLFFYAAYLDHIYVTSTIVYLDTRIFGYIIPDSQSYRKPNGRTPTRKLGLGWKIK